MHGSALRRSAGAGLGFCLRGIYSQTFSKSSCCRLGKSVQGFNRVGHRLFFGLVMEPCVLRLLSVWIRSGFERSVWQVRMYSWNIVRLVFFSSI
jgi:hypothetical protein